MLATLSPWKRSGNRSQPTPATIERAARSRTLHPRDTPQSALFGSNGRTRGVVMPRFCVNIAGRTMQRDRPTIFLAAALVLSAARPLAISMTMSAEAAVARHGPSPFCLLPGSSIAPRGAPRDLRLLRLSGVPAGRCRQERQLRGEHRLPRTIVRTPNGWRGQD